MNNQFAIYQKEDYLRMLSDVGRNSFYKKAIQSSLPKRVLDFGCGYPIMSYYCLLAGAEKVYAIDNNKELVPVLEKFKSYYPDRFEYFITDHTNLPDIEIDTVVYELLAPNLFHENIYTITKKLISKYGKIKFLPSNWNLSVSICNINQVEKQNYIFGVVDKFDWLHDKWKITKGPQHMKFMYPIDTSDWIFKSTDWYAFDKIIDTEWTFNFNLKEETLINLIYLNFKVKVQDYELTLRKTNFSEHWGNQFIALDPRQFKGHAQIKIVLDNDKRHLSADWVS